MTHDRIDQLEAEADDDLAEARRQGHREWIETLRKRQAALKQIRVGLTARDARAKPRPVADRMSFREPPKNTSDAFAADSDKE